MTHPNLPRAAENPFLANDLSKYVPSVRTEEWKFTNIQSVKQHLSVPEKTWQTEDIEKILPVVSGSALVIVNGHIVKDLSTLESLPNHITINTNAKPQQTRPTYLEGLQTAQQGILGDVAWVMESHPTQVTVKASASESILNLLIVGWGNGGPVGGGVKIHLESGAKLLVVEHVIGGHSNHGTNPLWMNTARELLVETGAKLRHVTLQNAPASTVYTQTQQVHVAEEASYEAFVLQVGASISRIETDLALESRTDLHMHSLQLVAPHCTHDVTSRMWLKGAAPTCNVTQRNLVGGNESEGGHAVFQGKYYVAQAAQKTDAYMRCENLLLHDAARVSQKPELEIYADDVKCSHGASTGSLDAEQVFYLKARGIDDATARGLLVSGFVEAQLEKFPAEVQPLVRPLVTKAIAEVVK